MLSALDQRKLLTFRARTYMAFVITPRAPIADWLADLDASLERSKGFFAGHPVALDLSAVRLSANAIAYLVAGLAERNIRVLGIEGAEFTDETAKLPPKLRSGQYANTPELSEPQPKPAVVPVPAPPQKPASLLIENPVRSGQSIVFTEGDVTVLGSVASGAEIIAGGSIHVYGALRGQAMAGAADNPRARIFCHKFEAELLAIGGYYKTADEIEASLRNGPIQAWLEGSTLKISAMN
ncbi:MAG TPA: septum site-determining protein MinC [Xanthobacteraceae bacterium]|nr:septum site-determining protein MinC [Xanthobacteraceae bacterium]